MKVCGLVKLHSTLKNEDGGLDVDDTGDGTWGATDDDDDDDGGMTSLGASSFEASDPWSLLSE